MARRGWFPEVTLCPPRCRNRCRSRRIVIPTRRSLPQAQARCWFSTDTSTTAVRATIRMRRAGYFNACSWPIERGLKKNRLAANYADYANGAQKKNLFNAPHSRNQRNSRLLCFFLIAADQNKRRNPNWICRGSEAAVAVPNAGSGTVPVPNVLFGNCRLVRFSVLKLSAIHSILKRSVTFS